jgi:adenylosuccinate synthase
VLQGLKEIKVCTHYQWNGEKLDEVPFDSNEWQNCEPVYRSFDGFEVNPKATKLEALSRGAQEYVRFIEKESKIPVSIVSVGADREQTIVRTA